MAERGALLSAKYHPCEAKLDPKVDNSRVGVWLIGAFGGVGTTVAVGLSALNRGVTATTALATELPRFAHLGFAPFGSFVVGGHDVRRSTFADSARELHRHSGVFPAEVLASAGDDLEAWSANVRPGLVWNSGAPVERFADWRVEAPSPAKAIDQIAGDLSAFASNHRLDHVVVVNVSSTEPMPVPGPEHASWSTLSKVLAAGNASSLFGSLPASSIYGLAAVRAGCSYVNFTPSLGLDSPALREHADQQGSLYMGRDGKTGETLMKAVLAPLFVRRNLEVLSWVGHNILGNRDGQVLQDPVNRQGKIESKGHLIHQILGYEPQTLVSIEHIASLGDWKTAWDHIHFRGFLDTKMSVQFIWQGCDSLLAAPLVIDLVRWTDLARRRGERGCMTHLAAYFKSPMRVDEQDFFLQWQMLEKYADRPVHALTNA